MNDDLFIALVIAFAAGLSSSLITTEVTQDKWQEQAIERGYAQFCPLDGEFAWNGECEDEK